MKKLIVSWDSYTWAHCLAGLISRNPKEYEIMIVTKDDCSPMHWSKGLCKKAIYAQRMDDIFWIGKALNINKLSNMLIDPLDFDENKLIAEFQMKLVFSGINKVYFQDNVFLENIFKAIKKKINLEIAIFDRFTGTPMTTTLTEKELEAKRELLTLMVALPHYQLDYDTEEHLYQI